MKTPGLPFCQIDPCRSMRVSTPASLLATGHQVTAFSVVQPSACRGPHPSCVCWQSLPLASSLLAQQAETTQATPVSRVPAQKAALAAVGLSAALTSPSFSVRTSMLRPRTVHRPPLSSSFLHVSSSQSSESLSPDSTHAEWLSCLRWWPRFLSKTPDVHPAPGHLMGSNTLNAQSTCRRPPIPALFPTKDGQAPDTGASHCPPSHVSCW